MQKAYGALNRTRGPGTYDQLSLVAHLVAVQLHGISLQATMQ